MLGFKTLWSATFALRNKFAGKENDSIKVVVLTCNNEYDELRLWYFESPKLVTLLSNNELILACYYAPDGNWNKFYGDELCWLLDYKRIAFDILNNTIFYDTNFAVNESDVLPSWLLFEIESCF